MFPVTIRLGDDVGAEVRSGMATDVTFHFEVEAERAAEHVVPTTAVGEDREGRFVFVVEGEGETGTVRRVAVEVGEIGTNGIEILDGLEDGQRVVTAGVSRIRDGLEVRVPPLDSSDGDEAG